MTAKHVRPLPLGHPGICHQSASDFGLSLADLPFRLLDDYLDFCAGHSGQAAWLWRSSHPGFFTIRTEACSSPFHLPSEESFPPHGSTF